MIDRERRNAIRRFFLTVFAKAIGAQVRWFRHLAAEGESSPPWLVDLPTAGSETEPPAEAEASNAPTA
ncbi:MAG: hypothetical protein JO199_01120 [Candidatus Eremiobacteraeota bacterium]|nr:hypothetical protein [Candidatus Eremiobacteraeota bacterium]